MATSNKRTKTLILCEAFYPETFLINDLTQHWEAQGQPIEVLTRCPSYPFDKIYDGYKNKIYQQTFFNKTKVNRIPVILGYKKNKLIKILNYFSFAFFTSVFLLWKGRTFKNIFIYQTGPLTVAIAGILHKKIFKSQVTIWTQDLWPDTVYAYGFRKTKFLSWGLDHFVKWIYTNCDHILVSCKGFAEKLQPYLKNQPVQFAPNWSLIPYCPNTEISLPGKYNFTFAGNIGKMQNLENIIRGFGVFVTMHPEAWLNIVGDGSLLEELRNIVTNDHIPNVNFTGRKPPETMSDIYQASNVLIISLIDVPVYEIMIPSKFPVYLTTGKPIYSILKGEVNHMVETQNLGFCADPSDIRDIAEGFEKFIGLPPKKLNQISKNAKNLSETEFQREKVITLISQNVQF